MCVQRESSLHDELQRRRSLKCPQAAQHSHLSSLSSVRPTGWDLGHHLPPPPPNHLFGCMMFLNRRRDARARRGERRRRRQEVRLRQLLALPPHRTDRRLVAQRRQLSTRVAGRRLRHDLPGQRSSRASAALCTFRMAKRPVASGRLMRTKRSSSRGVLTPRSETPHVVSCAHHDDAIVGGVWSVGGRE